VVLVPDHLEAESLNSYWLCQMNYECAGSGCLVVVLVPDHLEAESLNSYWLCQMNYECAGSGCLAVVLVPDHLEAEKLAGQVQTICQSAGLDVTVALAHYGIQV
jgi:hypothetical protein